METEQVCDKCRAALPADAPRGLCPACMMRAALESGAADPEAETLRGEVSPPPEEQPANRAPKLRYFGDYELLEKIAQGGMGVVFKARQVTLNRIVAVKMILGGQLAGEKDIQRFLAEAEAAANLQHPNIVAIHEVGQHEGQYYFSMDYVEGSNLAEYAQANPVSAGQAAQLVKTIALAVESAHRRGTLHRDLKPQNVLMDARGQPRVTDFGLAKFMERDSALTRTGAVMGSPSYMPPEQAAGRHDQAGPPSDVYSLGAILYQLLAGRPPFAGATPLETVRLALEADPTAPSKLNPRTPRDLEVICLKCLEKAPDRRYGTARELAEDLERFLNHEPVLARRTSAARKAWSWLLHHPWVLAGALALVLMTALGLAFGFFEETQYLRWKMDGRGAQPASSAFALPFWVAALIGCLAFVGHPLYQLLRPRGPSSGGWANGAAAAGALQIMLGCAAHANGIWRLVWLGDAVGFGGSLVFGVALVWLGARLIWDLVQERQFASFASDPTPGRALPEPPISRASTLLAALGILALQTALALAVGQTAPEREGSALEIWMVGMSLSLLPLHFAAARSARGGDRVVFGCYIGLLSMVVLGGQLTGDRPPEAEGALALAGLAGIAGAWWMCRAIGRGRIVGPLPLPAWGVCFRPDRALSAAALAAAVCEGTARLLPAGALRDSAIPVVAVCAALAAGLARLRFAPGLGRRVVAVVAATGFGCAVAVAAASAWRSDGALALILVAGTLALYRAGVWALPRIDATAKTGTGAPGLQLARVAVTLFALVLAGYAVENWRGARQWTTYAAQLRGQDEDFDLFSQLPPRVEPDENFAESPILKPLLAHGPAGKTPWAQLDEMSGDPALVGLLAAGGRAGAAATNPAPLPSSEEDIVAWVNRLEPQLSELRKSGNLPRAQIEPVFASPVFVHPNYRSLRTLAQALSIRARALLKLGRTEESFEDCRLIYRFAELMRYPTLSAEMNRQGYLDLELRVFGEGLSAGKWSAPQLLEFERQFAGIDVMADLDYVHRVGARNAWTAWGLAHAKTRLTDFLVKESVPVDSADRAFTMRVDMMRLLAPRGWIYQETRSLVRWIQDYAVSGYSQKAGRFWPAKVRQSQALLNEERRGWHPRASIASTMFPDFSAHLRSSARHATQLKEAVVASALERFRRKGGAYPAKLEQLVPDFLDDLPRDAITGTNLIYRRAESGGYVLYSVGWNEKDDGGVRGDSSDEGDWVWASM